MTVLGPRIGSFLACFATLVLAAGPALAQSTSAPLPPPMPPPAPIAAPVATVNVHVESDRPVSLFMEQITEEGSDRFENRPIWDDGEAGADPAATRRPAKKRTRWVVVCEAPCDRDLPLDATYRLDGPGVRSTRPFRFSGRPGEREVVKLEASSTASFVTGIAIGGVGVLGLGLGLGALLIAFSNSALGQRDNSEAVHYGLGFLAGGGVVTLVGTLIFTSNIHSAASRPLDAARAPTPAAPRAEPSSRHAAWRDVPMSPTRPALAVPLWSTTF